MPLTDHDLDHLAALLAPAAILVRPHAVAAALPAPPSSNDQPAWRSWFAALADDQLSVLLAPLLAPALANPELAAIAAKLGPRPLAHAAAPHVILKGLPIIDRAEVWAKLPSLLDGKYRILEIRGPSRAGKSYLQYLIRDFCNAAGPGHEVRYFDLDGAKALRFIARDIIAGLPEPAVLGDRDLANSTDTAWARSVAFHVYEAMRAAQPPITKWLVFDHFERARSDEAKAFFAHFTEQVALAASDPNVKHGPRLVLIDHGVPLAPVAGPVSTDVRVSKVTVPDLEQFGRRCCDTWTVAQAQRLYDDVRKQADDAIDELRRAAPGVDPPDPFMGMLCARVAKLIEGCP